MPRSDNSRWTLNHSTSEPNVNIDINKSNPFSNNHGKIYKKSVYENGENIPIIIPPRLLIKTLLATYGVKDVSNIVKTYIENSNNRIIYNGPGQLNQMFGDPTPGIRKIFTIMIEYTAKINCRKYTHQGTLNSIIIVMDELVNYQNLPEWFRDKLTGYNAFKNIGIEFSNIHNNRQACSPSRASLQTSYINVGIQDNIDQNYQYQYVPQLSADLDTIGKSMKRNNIDITAYYGKGHINSDLATDDFSTPMFNTNTRECFKQFGFDVFSPFGDAYYYSNAGYFEDNQNFSCMINNSNTNNVDYIDPESKTKYVGVLPFLTQRSIDKKSFHLQYHITNPHDTMHFWQNFSQTPSKTQIQYWAPFLNEQAGSTTNPYYYNSTFPNAFIQDRNLSTNFFEHNYSDYQMSETLLPFRLSYDLDYVTSSKTNSIFPFYAASSASMTNTFTLAENAEDIKSWKNLINNYYGLILEADNYVFKIFKMLESKNMLKTTAVVLTSDHGDLMSAHGLKQKGFPFRECVNVASVFYSPQLAKCIRGTKSNILGSLLDLAPTMETITNCKKLSTQFQGNSLLIQRNDGLYPRSDNNPVFNIFNSWMFYSTVVNFDSWYNAQPADIQKKVLGYPTTFYEYFCHYTMTIDNVDGKFYKWVRYYTLNELISYNLVFNSAFSNIKNQFSISHFTNAISPILLNQLPQLHTHIDNMINILKTLVSTSNNTFTFNQGFDALKNGVLNTNHISRNSVELTLFIMIIVQIMQNTSAYNLLIPGCKQKYDIILKYPQYYMFGYNLTDDPNETINLFDQNYPERQTPNNIAVFNQMNTTMNNLITSYNISSITYIIPNKVLVAFLISFLFHGINPAKFNDTALMNTLTYYGLNNLDSGTSTNWNIDNLPRI